LTALTLVPGTLNVRLSQPFDGLLPWYVAEDELGGNVWRDYAPDRTGIRCGEVLIAGRYRGIIFQGDPPEYPPDQVEIMSDHRLRDTLGLHDGDTAGVRGDRSLWRIWEILMCAIRVVRIQMP